MVKLCHKRTNVFDQFPAFCQLFIVSKADLPTSLISHGRRPVLKFFSEEAAALNRLFDFLAHHSQRGQRTFSIENKNCSTLKNWFTSMLETRCVGDNLEMLVTFP